MPPTSQVLCCDVFGEPVTFKRLGMEYDPATTAARDLWTENGGYLSRVRMWYAE